MHIKKLDFNKLSYKKFEKKFEKEKVVEIVYVNDMIEIEFDYFISNIYVQGEIVYKKFIDGTCIYMYGFENKVKDFLRFKKMKRIYYE